MGAANTHALAAARGAAAAAAHTGDGSNQQAAAAAIADLLHWLHDARIDDEPDWEEMTQQVLAEAAARFHRQINDGDDGDGCDEYALDLPSLNPDGEWLTFAYYDTRLAAIAAAREHFGADDQGRVCLVIAIPAPVIRPRERQ